MFKIAEKEAGINWEIAAFTWTRAKEVLEDSAVTEKLGSPLVLELEDKPLTTYSAGYDEKMYSVVIYCDKNLGDKAKGAIQNILDLT